MPVLRTDVADDRERAIAEIAQKARATRPRTSGPMWVAAIVAAVIGAATLVIVLFTDEESSAMPQVNEPVAGFSTGLVIGIAIGIALGFAIARQLRKPD